TGERALEVLSEQQHGYNLLVLDVMLPGINGFAVIAKLREQGELIPTLMLTARSRPEDVLLGFEAGADDYLPKPFELSILLARIHGLLRRTSWNQKRTAPRDLYEFSGRTIDFDNLQLRVGDKILQLTLMEASFFRFLIEREGQVVSRRAVLEQVWGLHEDTDTRAIDNFVVRLRRYIEEEPTSPKHLQTVRGVGYRFIARP
ncbi:MAG: response regulator transcription factor, partial [Bryobacteraceae bacterium]|nr:response regulator transcription factor [Bryobacteraceae bacterium]